MKKIMALLLTLSMMAALSVFNTCVAEQMSSELYAVRQKKSSRHETYCILPQCV